MDTIKQLNADILKVEANEVSGYQLNKLDLNTFPIVNDFEVKLKQAGGLGYHVYYFSSTFGELASFPWYDNVEKDLKDPEKHEYIRPQGTIDKPFVDLEQGWEFITFEKDDYFYILQGDFKEINVHLFYRWFKVKKEKYFEQWDKVITEAKDL